MTDTVRHKTRPHTVGTHEVAPPSSAPARVRMNVPTGQPLDPALVVGHSRNLAGDAALVVAADLARRLSARLHVVHGVDLDQTRGADLLVVGSRGHGASSDCCSTRSGIDACCTHDCPVAVIPRPA